MALYLVLGHLPDVVVPAVNPDDGDLPDEIGEAWVPLGTVEADSPRAAIAAVIEKDDQPGYDEYVAPPVSFWRVEKPPTIEVKRQVLWS